MAESGLSDALAQSFATAMRDAFLSWKRQHAPSVGGQEAFAMWVRRIEVSAQYAPGGRGFVSVEVLDRRPGRSTLESYQLVSSRSATTLERRKALPER